MPKKKKHDWKQAVKRAADICGGKDGLAEKADIKVASVNKLLTRASWGTETISAEVARRISDATGGAVGPHELRPDLWPAPEAAA